LKLNKVARKYGNQRRMPETFTMGEDEYAIWVKLQTKKQIDAEKERLASMSKELDLEGMAEAKARYSS
jgi:hypothetical protein